MSASPAPPLSPQLDEIARRYRLPESTGVPESDDVETLAAAVGLDLVPLVDSEPPAGVPVVVADQGIGRRWAVVPRLGSTDRRQSAGRVARAWLGAALPGTLAVAAAMATVLLAAAEAAAASGIARWLWVLGLVAGAALGVAGMLAAEKAAHRVARRFGWELRASVAAALLRTSDDDAGPDPEDLLGADAALTVALQRVTRPLVLTLGILAGGLPVVTTVDVAAALLLGAISALAVVVLVASLAPVGRHAVAAHLAAASARAALDTALAERATAPSLQPEMTGVEQALHATLDGHRQSRLAGLPAGLVATLLPVGASALILASRPEAVAGDTSDAVVVLGAAVVAGVALAGLLEAAVRSAVMAGPALHAIAALRARDAERAVPAPLSPSGVTIELREVATRAGDSPVSCEIEHGERMQIVDPDATRVERLAAALAGMGAPAEGHVRLGGVPMDRIAQERRAAEIATIDRVATLPPGTLREMLQGRDGTVDDAVLATTGLVGTIRMLPSGLDTPLIAAELWLPPEQRLRLLIASAWQRPAAILIIDRTLDDLDADARARLGQVLEQWPGTLIVTSVDDAPVSATTDVLYLARSPAAQPG